MTLKIWRKISFDRQMLESIRFPKEGAPISIAASMTDHDSNHPHDAIPHNKCKLNKIEWKYQS